VIIYIILLSSRVLNEQNNPDYAIIAFMQIIIADVWIVSSLRFSRKRMRLILK